MRYIFDEFVKYGSDEFADMAEFDRVAYNVCQIKEPATIKETFTSDHGKQWKATADLEFEALRDNQTWELVDLPDG